LSKVLSKVISVDLTTFITVSVEAIFVRRVFQETGKAGVCVWTKFAALIASAARTETWLV